MRKTVKLSLVVLALGTGLVVSATLRAQETPGSATPQNPSVQNQGPMMGNDMRGMMKMMGQMSQMMDHCNRMMQSMNDRTGSPSPSQPPK